MGTKFKISKELFEHFEKYGTSYIDEKGREIPDPRPKVIHTKLTRPQSLADQVRRLLRQELSERAQKQGFESAEEADDFYVEDIFEMDEKISGYEVLSEEYPLNLEGENDVDVNVESSKDDIDSTDDQAVVEEKENEK